MTFKGIIVAAISIAASVIAFITAGSLEYFQLVEPLTKTFFDFGSVFQSSYQLIIVAVIFYALIIAFAVTTIIAFVRIFTRGKITAIFAVVALAFAFITTFTCYLPYAYLALLGGGAESGPLSVIIFAGIGIVFALLAFDMMEKKTKTE